MYGLNFQIHKPANSQRGFTGSFFTKKRAGAGGGNIIFIEQIKQFVLVG